jgi:transposase
MRICERPTYRIETPPGQQTHINYAKMGLLWDPLEERRRVVYAFIATLSHSRLKYIEFTNKQDQLNFVASHVRMFEFFGGVVARLLTDNVS